VFIIGHGDTTHSIFFFSYQASGILTIVSLAFTVIAISSYGSKATVWMSWTGMTLGSSVFKSDTNNGGTLTPDPTGTVTANWVSDKRFIMWKEGTIFEALDSDFSKWSQANKNGYDSNYLKSTIITVTSTMI